MHALLLTCAMLSGLGGQKCLGLRLLAKTCDPKGYTCCAPKYGCAVAPEACKSCRVSPYSGESFYRYRLRFDYPWHARSPAPLYPAAIRYDTDAPTPATGPPQPEGSSRRQSTGGPSFSGN